MGGTVKLIVKVKEIKGRCPVYKIGDKIVLDEGYKMNLEETTAVCMHSLSSLLPYYNAIAKGIEPKRLGLAKTEREDYAYVQCLDPCEYTQGGTVVFEIGRGLNNKI
ncbi:MAG: TIGR04076 family protein [bacterium]|nr:TIGR04076 family protein [bacterium]